MSWSTLVSGDSVEVLSDDGGVAATWRPARIIHPFIARHLYFVVFDNGTVRATVSADRVRPKPPAVAVNFELGQLADALVDGVWSPGVVSKVHVAEGGRRYGVRIAREEIEVGSDEIRVRVDWVDGKWVSAEEKDKSLNLENLSEPKSDSQIELLYASAAAENCKIPGSVTHLSSGGNEDFHQPPISTPKAEIQNTDRLNFGSQLGCFHPYKKAKNGEAIDDTTRLFDARASKACKGAEFSNAEKMGFDVCTPIVEEEPNFRIKALVEKIDAVSAGGSVSRPSSTLMEIPPEKVSQESSLLHKPQRNKGEVLSKNRPINSEFLQSAERCQYRGAWWPREQRKELDHEGECQRDKGVGQHALRENRRKNSRPQKLRITAPSSEDSVGNHQKITIVGERPIELTTTKCGTCSDNDLEAQEQCITMAGSSDVSLIETSASDAQLSEAGSKSQDDVLLSTTGKQFAAQDQLPFEKCSFMWDSIESMKTFSLIPQHPHFLPLQRYRKDFREGMAIGLMVTFANLVNSITKLQISDSRGMFDDMLKTLGTLELHGFDVQRLKSRLVDLQRLKDDQEQHVDEKFELEGTLVKKEREKEQLNVEYESIDKAAKELEQSLSRLCEFKSGIFEGKRERDSKLETLEVESRKIDNAILAAKLEFEATLSAKW